MKFDLNKSLQELEHSDWGEPQEANTPLVNTCLELRRVPLIDFNGGDLLRMISQGIGIEYLIPRGLELLREDPLADRDVYPGSLLGALLQASSKYWNKNPHLREEVEKIYNQALPSGDLKMAHLTFVEFGPYISLLWENARIKQTCNCVAVELLAVIASRQPVTLKDLKALTGLPISTAMIEHLLKNKFITYDDEVFRLSSQMSLKFPEANKSKNVKKKWTPFPLYYDVLAYSR